MGDFGGFGQMTRGALAAVMVLGLVATVVQRRVGWAAAIAWCGLVWALVLIGLVTLVPLDGIDLAVPAETRSQVCSTDYGGPAPDGFWVLGGTQRLLNTLLFVPAGAFMALALTRLRRGWWLVPAGLVGLAAYSVAIELAQLALARLDRACDVTDMVDNTAGAVIGAVIGAAVAGVLRRRRIG